MTSALQRESKAAGHQETRPEARSGLKISVAIPTYNSASTIRSTLETVFSQSCPADEVLVLDDGSTDDTVAILESYKPRITVFQQQNRGVAAARNALTLRARGDLMAFLDHDDLWHPKYLERQKHLFSKFPGAVAFFTGHATFCDARDLEKWILPQGEIAPKAEIITQIEFVRRYTLAIGAFMSMSFCCVPKAALQRLGDRPFCESVSGVDDCYLFHQLSFFGPVVYYPEKLAAYRLSASAQSTDRIKGAGLLVRAMELLDANYGKAVEAKLRAVFRWAYATQRREYGKVLMGGGKASEARRQFLLSMSAFKHPISIGKSLGLLLLTCLPRRLQPPWLPSQTIIRA
jgi:glycosyltransferase involved in cell wall biosynthesis